MQRDIGAAEQGLAKAAADEQVERLLLSERLRDRNFVQHLLRRSPGTTEIVREGRLGQELQPVRLRRRQHLVQGEGARTGVEIVVVEHVVRDRLDLLHALAQGRAIEGLGVGRLGEALDRRPRRPDLLDGIIDVARLEQHDVAGKITQPATRQGIVADIGDALRRQQFAEERHDPLAHHLRHPGIDPVHEDVVEAAERSRRGHDVEMVEADIGGTEPAASALACAIARPLRSMPTSSAPGHCSAIGIRLPPRPQPSSRTRIAVVGAGVMPWICAIVARCAGCVCAKACPG